MASTPHRFIHINEGNTPADCLFDAWREITRPLFDTTTKERAGVYSADVAACMAGELFVSRVAYDPMVCHRSRPHLTHGDMDYYVLQLYVAGSERLFAGDSSFLIESNTVCLRDWRYGFTGISERNDIIGFAIPRHLLNTYGRINASRPLILWPLGSAPGKLLGKAILRIWRRLPHATVQEAARLSSSLVDLLNGILVNQLMGESEQLRINHAMQLTIKQYISDHLDDPTLGVGHLCHRFHLSRTNLYRLFKEEGGLQRYIREHRLRHCFDQLSSATSPKTKVREIAERWGFDNASHFNRLFKANFGLPPSELLVTPTSAMTLLPHRSIREAHAIQGWARGNHAIKPL